MINHDIRITGLLNKIAQMLFQAISVQDILDRRFFFDAIDYKTLAWYMSKNSQFTKNYSDLECGYLAKAVNDYICDRDELRLHVSRRGYIHVFDLLSELLSKLLMEENDIVYCRYSQMMQWRRLTTVIGEELPVTLMHVVRDLERGQFERRHFTWSVVAPQNNAQLNRIMERGISEHHCHLWASAPHFQISWLNLMNCVVDSTYKRNLERLDAERKPKSKDAIIEELLYSSQKDEGVPYAVLHLQAALIRLYLCTRIKKKFLLEPKPDDTPEIRLNNDRSYVRSCLANPEMLALETTNIQAMISSLMITDIPDYTLSFFHNRPVIGQSEYEIFSGERWFMYTILKDIFATNGELSREEHNYFFAYLRIQIEIRSLMLQTNDKRGFDNFQRYQRKKSFFLKGLDSKKEVARLAIREPLKKSSHLLEIEARIAPCDTFQENCRQILLLDRTIMDMEEITHVLHLEEDKSHDSEKYTAKFVERYYFVYYFMKRADSGLSQIPDKVNSRQIVGYVTEYRHYAFRKRIEKQMWNIVAFREKFSEIANRVKGIDACSQEIGCRPEVFASVFRMLGKHSCVVEDAYADWSISNLKKTYHVGEDFLDVVDGLRAIDEAVRFLNLECGDRLGHAIALGIDVDAWYRSKNYHITLPIQDYLDNVAWLYHVLERYQIQGMKVLTDFLEEQFEHYFRIVYLNYMDEMSQEKIMENAVRCYGSDEVKRSYKVHKCVFGIHEYYYAWTLRGDHPSLYKCGYYYTDNIPIDDWDRSMTNTQYPNRFDYRYIPEYSMLYYYYHYSADVKREGKRSITVSIRDSYIQGVKAVQKAMQFEVARRGLYVEMNPTSNVLISTFREYTKHPIVSLYNKGLVHSAAEIRACPQINVSINTDDKGVFFTDLENEYALMANAIESIIDEKGNPLYSKMEIYDWLDNIRQMGNMQSFRN